MLDFSNFECDNCGACCKRLIVEAMYYDAMREPRLYELTPLTPAELFDDERCIMLYDVETHACPFLTEQCLCEIYPTRPVACVLVQPGDAKCQQARVMSEIPLLPDKNREIRHDLIWKSCRDYGLAYEEFFDGDDFKQPHAKARYLDDDGVWKELDDDGVWKELEQ